MMGSKRKESMEPVLWVKANAWVRQNFGCDAHDGYSGDHCTKTVAWILNDEEGRGPVLSLCAGHYKAATP